MNWKLRAGQIVEKIDNLLRNSNSSFIKKNYPYRRNWAYDLQRQLPEVKTIFDVGAYVGDVSTELSEKFPDARIFAFEPVNQSFNKLQAATKSKNQITATNVALGQKEEVIEIPLFSEGSISTLKSANYDHPAIAYENIRVERLDDFARKNNIDNIDLLKIDTEGFELEVLNGAGDFLSKIGCIVVEVGYVRSDTKTHFTEVDRFMEDKGFELFNIYNLMPFYNDRTRLHFADHVYLNKNRSR